MSETTAPSGQLLISPAFAGEGRVTLTLPPQAIAEAKFDRDDDVARRGARLSGPSQVTFLLADDTQIEMTAEGLLAALAAAGQHVELVAAGREPTAIELPWHLTLTLQHLTGGQVVSRHDATAVTSVGGVAGLWHARLCADGAGEDDAALLLLPLHADQDDAQLDVQPLSGQQRQSIVDAAHAAAGPALARARRVGLGPLGGTLSAALSSADLEWNHDATLGRDHQVRTAEHGVLYPFGHRAIFVETARRELLPAGDPAVAGLHREAQLIIIDRKRATTDGELELRRRFPFSEVEILAASFPHMKPPSPADFTTVRRPVVPHGELADEQQQLRDQRAELAALVQQRIDDLPDALQAYLDAHMGSSDQLADAQQHLADTPDPQTLREENAETNRTIDLLEHELGLLVPTTGADGETIEPDPAQVQALQDQISALIATLHSNAEIQQAAVDFPAAVAAVQQLQAAVQREFDNLARTLDALAAQGDEQAVGVQNLDAAIAALQVRLDRLDRAEHADEPLAYVPQTPDGTPLRFPLRFAAAASDVVLDMPLVFVRDFSLREEEFLPAFSSLTDPTALATVASLWQGHAVVPVPGVPIDMVNSGQPQPLPGDVHQVHALTLAGVAHSGGFRPTIGQFDVELPSLRSLLPETGGVRPLHFTEAFLNEPEIPELPFTLDPRFTGDPAIGIGIDFVRQAQRSGGLVSPKFVVDGISRRLGPVAARALPPGLADALPPGIPTFDLASVYAGATLLGFPLTSLIKLPLDPLSAATDALPKPPAMTQLLDAGIPTGMRMSWTLDLQEHGPFRPGPATKLTLTVECSAARQDTTCTVNDFALVLPPGGSVAGLLTLNFRSLQFAQHEGRTPELKIDHMTVGFGGALKLLQELQAELQKVLELPDTGVKVDVRPTGLTAGYGVAVPSVTAGTFLLSNIAMQAGVDVPFDGKPVTVSLSFAKRDNPFTVSVMAFGGGGYLDMTLGPEGLMRLEASIDFGAAISVDFFVARGEVHALGGVRFRQAGGSIDIDGFISIGGSVEVLGLVSVSIELLVTLSYRDGNRLVGRATIVVEVDLTLFSRSVEIDSGEWVLAGSESPARERLDGPVPVLFSAEEDPRLAAWRAYRQAFATA
ncbi:hypothetical protein [Capillimicrobium parvum]|uniref:hypothetical protein n=1 Tax=Capillimicrobium parvum TaxID=2884022 RepID=UPI00216B30CD|nr:hypothetical protein [Capillimicrobium parvum]